MFGWHCVGGYGLMIILIPWITSTPVHKDLHPSNPYPHPQPSFIDMTIHTASPDHPLIPLVCQQNNYPLHVACLAQLIQDTCISHHTPIYSTLLGFHTKYSYVLNMYFYKLNVSMKHPRDISALFQQLTHHPNLPVFYQGHETDQDVYFEFKCARVVPASKQFDLWYRGDVFVQLLFHL